MGRSVSVSEAVAILRRMIEEPVSVRAIRGFDDSAYGPLPFFVSLSDEEAEVTFSLAAGIIVGVVSVRIGDRFSNEHDWIDQGSPWDQIREIEAELLQIKLGAKAFD